MNFNTISNIREDIFEQLKIWVIWHQNCWKGQFYWQSPIKVSLLRKFCQELFPISYLLEYLPVTRTLKDFMNWFFSNNLIKQSNVLLTHFMSLMSFDAPLKTSKNLWFSDVFRGYQNRTVAWNELKQLLRHTSL